MPPLIQSAVKNGVYSWWYVTCGGNINPAIDAQVYPGSSPRCLFWNDIRVVRRQRRCMTSRPGSCVDQVTRISNTWREMQISILQLTLARELRCRNLHQRTKITDTQTEWKRRYNGHLSQIEFLTVIAPFVKFMCVREWFCACVCVCEWVSVYQPHLNYRYPL